LFLKEVRYIAYVHELFYPNDEETNNHENWVKATNGANPDAQAIQKVYWAP